MLPLNELTAAEIAERVRSGNTRVVDVAEAVIARIEARQPDVAAYAWFDRDAVLAQARALDAEPVKGPLHGVPLAVKDVFDTKDMPTQYNSPRYAGNRPSVDAACIDTMRAAGVLLVGKTVTTEFADSMRGGATRNPRDLARTPGGSSSGSAAAIADFQATIALGTQTGGSTIRPASYNGVFAMKPTWTAISREGFKLSVPSCDTVGLYARSADDLMLLADVFDLQPFDAPPPTSLAGARIGLCRTAQWPKAQAETQQALARGGEALRAAGAEVRDLELPAAFAGLGDLYFTIYRWETRTSLLNEYRNNPDLADEFKARVENRDRLTADQARAAYRLADRCRAELDDIFADYDVILAPSATGEAPVGHDWTGDASFNCFWTLLQIPIVNVPGFSGPHGMPVGLSVIGRRYDDRKAIAYAKLAATAFAEAAGR